MAASHGAALPFSGLSYSLQVWPLTRPSRPYGLAMRMVADIVLSWGKEDLPRLIDRLLSQQPGARVSVLEPHDDGSPRLIRWEHPAPSPYGKDCFTLWQGFLAAIRQSWASNAAESACQDASFVVLDADGKRIGRIEGAVEPGGWRHLVDGQPIHCGEALDLLTPDGLWLKGRYEMDRVEDGLPIPLFCTRAYRGDITTRITDSMVVRIPQR